MPGETSKRRADRIATGWFEKYLIGKGIDIGCGDDPVTPDCARWDLPEGNAQYMEGIDDESFDWVYSSHCLEHMCDPSVALGNWWRILKPGGHLIVMVPDEDLYEQGHWPSAFNSDHKTTWTIRKRESWSPVSRNLLDELELLPQAKVVSTRLLDKGYDYSLKGEYRVSLHLSNMNLGSLIEKDRMLTLDKFQQHPTAMKLLGFFAIDQTTEPMVAEVSLEGIARKEG